MNEKIPLKSIYTCLRLPIIVLNSKLNTIVNYPQNGTAPPYNFKSTIKSLEKKEYPYRILSGRFDEIFLYYFFEDTHFIFGPIKCSANTQEIYDNFVNVDLNFYEQRSIYQYLKSIPSYSIKYINNLFTLICFLFTNKIEFLIKNSIANDFSNLEQELEQEHINSLLSYQFEPEKSIFIFDNKILECIKNKDKENLNNIICMLNSTSTNLSNTSLRSEKDFSIIIFEKLSKIAISLGLNILRSYEIRNIFIKKTEQSLTINEVIQVRENAIHFFISETEKIETHQFSSLITSILQYINFNIQKKITIHNLAKLFNMSETKLRSIFKKELKITIQQYIIQQKISEAKILLKSNFTILEVANQLGFSDSSHFSKMFKKNVGICPKKYQQQYK